MNKKDTLDDMLQYATFYHIKEMLLCMDGLSYSDNRMVKIINSHGGLDRYYEELEARYIKFQEQKRRI